jgi:hypothetical protein
MSSGDYLKIDDCDNCEKKIRKQQAEIDRLKKLMDLAHESILMGHMPNALNILKNKSMLRKVKR